MLATNNSTRTPQQFVDKLAGMGVTVHAHEVSDLGPGDGQLPGRHRAARHPGVCHRPGWAAATALREAGFDLVEDDAEYVVAGMDFSICYERLARGHPPHPGRGAFVGTNPDLTFPSERGIVPGAGSLLAFLEAATGVTPTIIGKPETAMMEQALARMGAEAATTAMLGDRLETDILAGQRAGLLTLLVLSGVTDRALLAESEIQPDLVFRRRGPPAAPCGRRPWMADRIALYDLTHDQLADLLAGWGEPRFRADQVWRWLYRSLVDDFEAMGNLPAALRARLAAETDLAPLTPMAEQVSASGQTRKVLFRLRDGNTIESV